MKHTLTGLNCLICPSLSSVLSTFRNMEIGIVSVPMVLVICALAIPLLPAERMIERIIDCSCVRVAFLRIHSH